MRKVLSDASFWFALTMLVCWAAVIAVAAAPTGPATQAPVKVELTPEVRYAIQEETRRQMIEHRKQMTRPILPMVAPDPKVKVRR